MTRPTRRLRRVLAIARRSRLQAHNLRLYQTEINAEPCEACGLTRGRHLPGCEPDPECAF